MAVGGILAAKFKSNMSQGEDDNCKEA